MKGQIPVWSSENSGNNLRTANRKHQIDRPYGPLLLVYNNNRYYTMIIIIIFTTIIIKTNTCTTLLTVAHKGTMTVNACASPKHKIKKKNTGRVGPM
jgi:hypothetical protein